MLKTELASVDTGVIPISFPTNSCRSPRSTSLGIRGQFDCGHGNENAKNATLAATPLYSSSLSNSPNNSRYVSRYTVADALHGAKHVNLSPRHTYTHTGIHTYNQAQFGTRRFSARLCMEWDPREAAALHSLSLGR